jgi:hypothetical protein
MEVDRNNEILFVPKTARRVLHPLNLGIERFAGRVRDPMPQVRNDVLESSFEHRPHLDHRLQAAAYRPTVPPIRATKWCGTLRAAWVMEIWFLDDGYAWAKSQVKCVPRWSPCLR